MPLTRCKQWFLPILVLVGCGLFLTLKLSDQDVHAQTTCNGQPPLKSNAVRKAWPRGMQVATVVFDGTSDFTIIRDAIPEWNAFKVSNCSNVTFGTPIQSLAPYDPAADVPDATIYVSRLNSGSQLDEVFDLTGNMIAARMNIQNPFGSNTPGWMRRVVKHEAGHSFGLLNSTIPLNTDTIMGSSFEITQCDTEAIRRVYCPSPTATPTSTPTPRRTPFYPHFDCEIGSPLTGGNEAVPTDESDIDGNPSTCCTTVEQGICPTWQWVNCVCISPIVIDVLGNGFDLTSAQNGVMFDIAREGTPRQVAWTSSSSDDAWLVLDRNGNGVIDHAGELFGSASAQSYLMPGESKNGFRALAVFDRFDAGGNGDGKINSRDDIFEFLQLWQDVNHNGISEPNELHSLTDLGLRVIGLDYQEKRRYDMWGNWFRYRSKVRDAQDAQMGRWAWDVFPQTLP